KQERQRGGDRDDVEKRPCTGSEHADDRGHPHVLATLERDDRTEHREPKEQDTGKLVRPYDRCVKDVTGNDAEQEDDDLRDDQQRGWNGNRRLERAGQTCSATTPS